jgi:pyrroline-5-carboxylate reductase
MKTIKKLGFLGFGNMASALARGILAGKELTADDCLVYDHGERGKGRARALGLDSCSTLEDLLKRVDTLIVAIHPGAVAEILKPQVDLLDHVLVLSVVGGMDYASYASILPEDTARAIILPNVAASAGQGLFLMEDQHNLSPDQVQDLEILFQSMGLLKQVSAADMKIGSVIGSCSPAFFSLVLEALSDAAVEAGMNRQLAVQLAAQAMVGAGALNLDPETNPAQVKNRVTSPGGSTIRGVIALEEEGVRQAFVQAFRASYGD